jgi:hypothetical protein
VARNGERRPTMPGSTLRTTGQLIARPLETTTPIDGDERVLVAVFGVLAVDPKHPLNTGEGMQFTFSDLAEEVIDPKQFYLVGYPCSMKDLSERTERHRADQILCMDLWRV